MTYAFGVLLAGLVATPMTIVVLRRLGVLDVPNHRSNHEVATVRGAGLGVAAVTVGALLLVEPRDGLPALAVFVGLFSMLGFVDDLRGLSVTYRLPIQFVLATSFVILTDLPAEVVPIAVVLIVGYINAFNFMDGINGISVLHALPVGVTWIAAGYALDSESGIVLGGVISASALAFLPFNFPVARGFLGDVGSYFFGATIALSAVALSSQLPVAVLGLPLAPYVVDTAWTLLRRVRRGERWHEAHREHVYQRVLSVGWSHTSSAILVGTLTALGGGVGLALSGLATVPAALLLLGYLLCLAGYLMLPTRLERRSSRTVHP